jgi:hypothetical protein
MTAPAQTKRNRRRLYGILIGIILVTIPCYCAGLVAIRRAPQHVTPTASIGPTFTQAPFIASPTPTSTAALTATPTRTITPTPFVPPTPTPTFTPEPTKTPTPTPTNTPTLTPTAAPTG